MDNLRRTTRLNTKNIFLTVLLLSLFVGQAMRVEGQGCRIDDEVVTSVDFSITVDDKAAICFPLTISIGARSFVFAGPGVRTGVIACPRCGLAYTVRSTNPAQTCQTNGTISAAGGTTFVTLSLAGEQNDVIFEIADTREQIVLPLPVTELAQHGSEEFCSGNTIQLIANTASAFSPETLFEWRSSSDSVLFTSISGESGQVVTFQLPSVIATQKNYFRANSFRNYVCNTRAYGNVDPENLSLLVYPQPPPIVSVFGVAPSCPGGEGSIEIIHDTLFAPGTEFIYSLTQYLPESGALCADTANSFSCQQIPDKEFLKNFCGLGQPQSFCRGGMGTFTKTISSTALEDRTVFINSTLDTSPSGPNTLKLFPGIYELEVELNLGVQAVCVKRYFVEIPLTLYSPLQISDPVITDLPLCIGGNEGAVQLFVTGGLQPYNWRLFDNQTGARIDSLIENSTFITSRLLAHSTDTARYRVQVRDACTNEENSPGNLEFNLDQDGLERLQLSTDTASTVVNIGCYELGIGNGAWAIQVGANSPNVASGFKYSLFAGPDTTHVNLVREIVNQDKFSIFTQLALSEYTVRVEAPNGCINTITKSDFALPAGLNGTFQFVQPCLDQSNGSIIFNRSSGSDTIEFTDNGMSLLAIQSENIFTIADVGEGVHTVSAIDHCISSNTVDLQYQLISEPEQLEPLPSLALDQTNTNIFNGAVINLACYGQRHNGALIQVVDGSEPLEVIVFKDSIPFTDWTFSNRALTLGSLDEGEYDIEISDACQASVITSFQINAPSIIEAEITPLNLTCHDNASGEIRVEISGGTPTYQASLFNVGTNESIGTSRLCEGGQAGCLIFESLQEDIPYRVEVSDQNGCMRVFDQTGEIKTLSSPQVLSLIPIQLTDITGDVLYQGVPYLVCKGQSNAGINVAAEGGTSPYTFSIAREGDVQFPEPFDSSALGSFDSLSAGHYFIAVTDVNGCRAGSENFSIYESDQQIIASVSAPLYANGKNISCYAGSNGQIQILASGGVIPFTYVLSNSNGDPEIISDQNTFDNLPAITNSGDLLTYTISLQDFLGCSLTTNTISERQIELTSPEPVGFQINQISTTHGQLEVLCKDGVAELSIASHGGHFPAHHYTIRDVNGNSIIETGLLDSSNQVNNFELPAGEFQIELTDGLDCSAPLQQIIIDEPTSEVHIAVDSIVFPGCINGNGEIHVSGLGGTPGPFGSEYRFRIRPSNNAQFDTTVRFGNEAVFYRPANLYQSREYEIEITDNSGCSETAFALMAPDPTPLSLQVVETTPPSCYGAANGTIRIVASNVDYLQTTSFLLMIQGGALAMDSVRTISSNSLDYTIDSLEATNVDDNIPFTIWIEDNNHCEFVALQYIENVVISSHPPIEVQLDEESRLQPSCFEGNDASMVATISGGVAPYYYSYNNGIDFEQVPVNSIVRDQLYAGQYDVVIRDALFDSSQSFCQKNFSYAVAPGRLIDLSADITDVSCKNGHDGEIHLTVAVENLIFPEEFSQDSVSINWTSSNSITENFNNNGNLLDVKAGLYSVVVLYDVGEQFCSNQKTFSVLEPNRRFAISDIRAYNADCLKSSLGKAVVNIDGGWSSTVSYLQLDGGPWRAFSNSEMFLKQLNSGVHEVKVAQNNLECLDSTEFTITNNQFIISSQAVIQPSCSGALDGIISLSNSPIGIEYTIDNETFQPNLVFTGLAANTYTVRGRKLNDPGCLSETIQVLLDDPADCDGGPLQGLYLFSTPATCSNASDATAGVIALGGLPPYAYYWDGQLGAETASGLAKGEHNVTIVDSAGSEFNVAIFINELPPIEVETFTTLTSCTSSCDGSIDLFVSGGTSDFDVAWMDFDSTMTRTSLCIGDYSFQISDKRNSICLSQGMVTIGSQPQLEINLIKSQAPTCYGGSNGQLLVAIAGGSGGYSLEWDNGLTTEDNRGLTSGYYYITVKDTLFRCELTQAYNLADGPAVITLGETVTTPSCNGFANGQVSVNLGGSLNSLVQWDNGHVGPLITNLKAGNYAYQITDGSGCTETKDVMINEPEPLSASYTIDTPSCNGASDGQVNLTIIGGTAPYSLSWSIGARTPLLQNLAGGNYSVTIKDRNQCELKSSVSVLDPEKISLAFEITNPTCYGTLNGTISTVSSGGTGMLSFKWNTGQSTGSLSGVGKGKYTLIATDENNCSWNKTATVIQPQPLLLNLSQLRNPSCFSSVDGLISVNGSGGNGGYTYSWNDGTTGAVRSNLGHGAYQVSVVDQKTCQYSKAFSLIAPPALAVKNIAIINPTCVSDSNGAISLVGTGGVSPYQYAWNTGELTSHITGKMNGTYSVKVTDQNSCLFTRTFALTDPDPLMVEGIPTEKIICTGNEVIFEPSGSWSSYNWSGPNGFNSTLNAIQTGIAGNYSLTVTNSNHCQAQTNVNLIVSANALQADFLRVSEAIQARPIVFINLSTPAPYVTQWLIPPDPDIIVKSKSNTRLELIFNREDTFELGLKATSGNCESIILKDVIVSVSNARSGGRMSSKEIVDVRCYPNPMNTLFTIDIDTSSDGSIALKLISGFDHRVLHEQQVEGSFHYNFTWDVSKLNAGVYYLMYEHNGDVNAQRLVVIH